MILSNRNRFLQSFCYFFWFAVQRSGAMESLSESAFLKKEKKEKKDKDKDVRKVKKKEKSEKKKEKKEKKAGRVSSLSLCSGLCWSLSINFIQ